jgi:CRISPR-associated endonuclease/helicase Cas3
VPLTRCGWLCVLAGLHDLGKVRAGWQDYIHQIGKSTGHVAPTLAALFRDDPGLVEALSPVLSLFAGDDIENAVFTTICHHGRPVPEHIWNQQPKTEFGGPALAEIGRLIDELLALFPAAQEPAGPLIWTCEVEHLFAGLLMMADWRASSLRLDMPDIRPEYIRATLRDHQPREITDLDMGISSWRPMQKAVGEAPLQRVMLIEDMTGSGKTEAALRLALRHLEAGHADAIRFCVPTRSAASQLYERISRLVQAARPGASVVRALPGEMEMDTWDGEGPRPWAICSSKHSGVSNVAVGTIDQALLGILRVRGAWARRSMDQRSVMIIDEVHAGDPYMIALVEFLTALHPGPVILMTATLGHEARSRLLGDTLEGNAAYPWRAPIGWSGLIVSAWSACGPLVRCFLARAAGIPRRCAA